MIVLVAAIADEHTFFVNHAVCARFRVIAVVNRIVGPAPFEGDGQMSRGIDGAEEDFSECGATALSGIPEFEIGGNAFEPVAGIDIATGGNGDDGVLIERRRVRGSILPDRREG